MAPNEKKGLTQPGRDVQKEDVRHNVQQEGAVLIQNGKSNRANHTVNQLLLALH